MKKTDEQILDEAIGDMLDENNILCEREYDLMTPMQNR